MTRPPSSPRSPSVHPFFRPPLLPLPPLAYRDAQDLGAIFGNFGEVMSSTLVTDDYGDSKGYGFVKVRAQTSSPFFGVCDVLEKNK